MQEILNKDFSYFKASCIIHACKHLRQSHINLLAAVVEIHHIEYVKNMGEKNLLGRNVSRKVSFKKWNPWMCYAQQQSQYVCKTKHKHPENVLKVDGKNWKAKHIGDKIPVQ